MSLTSITLFAGLAVIIGLPVMGQAATWCVNPGGTGGCYSSIQSAVDAAGSGDTITVETGTYSENVTVDIPLTLLAGGTPTLQGCISISIDNATVSGFSFDGGGVCPSSSTLGAVYLLANTGGHTITNNVLSGPGASVVCRGILFGSNVSDVTISGNDITEWRSGIYANPSRMHLHFNRQCNRERLFI